MQTSRYNPFGFPNTGTGLSSTGISKPNMPWPGTGSMGSTFPSLNGVGSSTRWGSTGLGAAGSLNTAPGGTGTLSSGLGSTGLGGSGSSRTGLTQAGTSSMGGVGPGMTGFGSAGSSPISTGNIGQSGTGSSAFSSAGSSGVGMGKPGIGGTGFSSVGSNVPGFGTALGGVRTTGGEASSQTLSQGKPSRSVVSLHFLT